MKPSSRASAVIGAVVILFMVVVVLRPPKSIGSILFVLLLDAVIAGTCVLAWRREKKRRGI